MSEFDEIIRTRRSIRKYTQQKVEPEKILKVVQAALLAPSGKRMYPCEFIIIEDKQILEALSKAKTHGAKLISDAPLAIVITVDTLKYDVWVEDASIASTFVMLAAENLGLGACWVQMHLRGTEDGKTAAENMKETLNLPAGYEILSVIAIGYKAEEKAYYKIEELDYKKIHLNKIGNPFQK